MLAMPEHTRKGDAPSREAALEKLQAFLPKAGRQYRSERNFDQGPGQHSSVSGLSPFIRHRLISEAEVLRAVLDRHTLSAAEKFVQEVYWRTYWKGWLEHRPGVWTRYLDALNSALGQSAAEVGLREGYERAQEGRTGIEPFDEWVRELVETGYLHNHARMWFASIWIFTLELPWELGADFFLRHLLDGDPASNTLSWRWVAGLHTAGKTYLATAGNIEKYAGQRFFTDGPPAGLTKLSRRAPAQLEDDLPPAAPPSLPDVVDSVPGGGLLLTEEDLHLDAPFAPRSVALWMPNAMYPLPASERVSAFKCKAGDDALKRAGLAWPQASVTGALGSVTEIVDWAQQQGLEELRAAYIPQGHLRSQVTELRQALARIDCELHFFVRDYDRVVWPHTSRGFFQLKKQIPKMLESL